MLSGIHSTDEPNASLAMSKPVSPALRRANARRVSSLLPAGQSQSWGSGTSIATTSAAPLRSISKAQNPLNVPTSRQRLPSSEGGRPTVPSTLRVSKNPGVTTPGASSIVWYHSSTAATRSARSPAAGRATLMAAPYQQLPRPM